MDLEGRFYSYNQSHKRHHCLCNLDDKMTSFFSRQYKDWRVWLLHNLDLIRILFLNAGLMRNDSSGDCAQRPSRKAVG